MEIKPETLADWMKFIRFHPDLAERFMDCFWESQLTSKSHLLYALEDFGYLGNVYIFGGWFGILGKLIEDSYLQSNIIVSVDKDPICDWVIKNLYSQPSRVMGWTQDMGTFEYAAEHPPTTVINTSTEHVTQEVYERWWKHIPAGTVYALQGNNFWDDPEHIRCAHDIDEFKKINLCENVKTEFSFPCGGPNNSEFMRYMVIGVK